MLLIAAAAAATAAQLVQAFVESRAALALVAALVSLAANAWLKPAPKPGEAKPMPRPGGLVRQVGGIAFAVGCALGCTRAAVPPTGSDDVVALLSGLTASTGEWRIEARVSHVASSGSGGARWLLDVLSVADPVPRPLRGRLQLYVRTHVPPITAGDRVRFNARLRRISGFGNPGEIDWVGWNARRGTFVSAFVWDGREIEKTSVVAQTAKELVDALRMRITRAASADRGRGGALVAALVTGERRLLEQSDARAVTAAGLAHLLAISGLHLSLVGGGVYWLVHRVLLETPLVRAGVDIARGAVVAGVSATIVYTAISGGGVSVARATSMAILAAAAMWQGRRGTALSALGAAALAISLVMPGVARESGFQLSFAAVAAILAYGNALARRPKAPSAAFAAIELSFLCWAVSTPIVAQHFGRVAVYGAVATMATAPLATVTVAAGLAGALGVAVELPGLEEPCFAVGAWAAEWLLRTAHTFALMPAAHLHVVAPGPVAAAAAASLPFSLLMCGRARRLLATAAAAVLGLCVLAGARERYRTDALDVYFLSVGQGDSTVVRLPGGKIALVDAGLPGRGGMVVAPFLSRAWVKRVDYLVATHAQDDHAGGIAELLDDVEVGELWIAAGSCRVEWFAGVREAARDRGVAIVEIGEAGRLPVRAGNGWRLSALWPQDARGACDDNDRSVVVAVEFAGRRILLNGDIEAPAEKALIAALGPGGLKADVLSAPHHGSRTSSSPAFVAATSPEVVVASAGRGNRYGFPRDETRLRYLAAGSRFLTTATDGAVHVRIDERGGLEVRTALR